jgi:hypothetical protein
LFLDYTDDGTVFEVIPLGQKSEENWFMAGEEDYEPEGSEDEEDEEMLKKIGMKERERMRRIRMEED